MKQYKKILIGLWILLVISLVVVFSLELRFYDIALYLREWTKSASGKAVDLDALEKTETVTVDHALWSNLLGKYVDELGKVDYKGFQADSTQLSRYLDVLSKHPPGSNWSEAETMAYWINTYNAFTVKLILDHYPLQSIKDIRAKRSLTGSPWDMKFFKIGGVPFDLGTIEHQILRKQFVEPRIHFAINCASISCPKLRQEAYEAAKLEQQLEEQAIAYILDPQQNLINEKQIRLSKIFDWFRRDFTRSGSLAGFLKKYKADLNPALPIRFMEYDWGLNGQ